MLPLHVPEPCKTSCSPTHHPSAGAAFCAASSLSSSHISDSSRVGHTPGIAGWWEVRVLLGSPSNDNNVSGDFRCAAALKASNPVPLPRAATALSMPVWGPCSPIARAGVGACLVPMAPLKGLTAPVLSRARRIRRATRFDVDNARRFSVSGTLDVMSRAQVVPSFGRCAGSRRRQPIILGSPSIYTSAHVRSCSALVP